MAILRPVTKTLISSTSWGIPITDEVNRLTPLVDGRVPTAWTSVTLQNGFTAVVPCQYRKVGDMVQLRGRLGGSSVSVTCFTLPTGFRPPATVDLPTAYFDGAKWLGGSAYVDSSGNFIVTNNAPIVQVGIHSQFSITT